MNMENTSTDYTCWGFRELIERIHELESANICDKQDKYEDEMLGIINEADEFTQSDVQGIVSAFVGKVMNCR